MNLLSFFARERRSAPVARDRLQVLLAHERGLAGGADLAAVLHQEILAVIAKHIPIDRDQVAVKLDQGDQVSTLAIDIEMPRAALAGVAASSPPKRSAKGRGQGEAGRGVSAS